MPGILIVEPQEMERKSAIIAPESAKATAKLRVGRVLQSPGFAIGQGGAEVKMPEVDEVVIYSGFLEAELYDAVVHVVRAEHVIGTDHGVL